MVSKWGDNEIDITGINPTPFGKGFYTGDTVSSLVVKNPQNGLQGSWGGAPNSSPLPLASMPQPSSSSFTASLQASADPLGNGSIDIFLSILNSSGSNPDNGNVWVVSKDNLSQLEKNLVQQLTSQAKNAGINIVSIGSVNAVVTQNSLVNISTLNTAISLVSIIGAYENIDTMSDAYDAAGNALGAIGLYALDEYVSSPFDPTSVFTAVQDQEWNQVNQTLILAEQTLQQPLFKAAHDNAQQNGNPVYVIQANQGIEIAITNVQYSSASQQTVTIATTFNCYSYPTPANMNTPAGQAGQQGGSTAAMPLNNLKPIVFTANSAAINSGLTTPLPPTTPHFP